MTGPAVTTARVLVVDDEPHIGQIIRTRLEQGPFTVMLAGDGGEALALLAQHDDTRLIVLDLMLPGMSGLEVLRTLRQDDRWRALPCLVLTAAGQDSHFREAQALGVADVLTKPFSPRRLFERVLALTVPVQHDA
ncbi:MAG TPA: response regulator [Gemmatimonas sp.]|nr:response regulator [Gemmatimonas sp.]